MRIIVFLFLLLSCSEGIETIREKLNQAVIDNNFQLQKDLYLEIVTNHSKSEDYPIALFQIAFISNNHLNDLETAKTYYEKFIAEFPTHEMVASAKFELDNLGVPIEELPIFKSDSSKQEIVK